MQVPVIKDSDTTFGYRIPKKKTFQAMSGYYKLKNNKSAALEYSVLHTDAMARMHYINFLKASRNFEKFCDKTAHNNFNFKETAEFFKHLSKMAYERLLSSYYYCRII